VADKPSEQGVELQIQVAASKHHYVLSASVGGALGEQV
jgi:hypothetical protein